MQFPGFREEITRVHYAAHVPGIQFSTSISSVKCEHYVWSVAMKTEGVCGKVLCPTKNATLNLVP